MPSGRTSTPLPFCAPALPMPSTPNAIARADGTRRLDFMAVSRTGLRRQFMPEQGPARLRQTDSGRTASAPAALGFRAFRVVVEAVEARQPFNAREYAIREPVAVAVPQRVGVQRAAEPALFDVQALAAFVHANAVFDAGPDVLQPAHVIKVVAIHRRVIHAQELVQQAFGIAQHEVE